MKDLRRYKQLQILIQKLGLSPQTPHLQWSLIDLALTHPSMSPTDNYEQLEFVGDAVVRLATSSFLLENYPELSVGQMSAVRSILVSDRILAQMADRYGLERYLLLSKSALADSLGRQSRLADAFEALLASLYLSCHDLSLIQVWLDSHLKELTDTILRDPAHQNYKAALQEWTQARHQKLPEYRVIEASTVHGNRERFCAEVWFQEECLGVGKGRSIKQAEQAAAKAAFARIME